MDEYSNQIAQAVAASTGVDAAKIKGLLASPPDETMGDIGFPCFVFSKELRQSPAVLAKQWADKITEAGSLASICDKVSAAGPYVNFTFNSQRLITDTLGQIWTSKKPGVAGNPGQGQTVVIDYSSPNIAKPLAIHHIRSTIIGAALCRIYRALGYKVEAINHLGDWGTNFGQLMVSYKKEEEKNPGLAVDINKLLQLYIQFHVEAEDNEALNDEARAWFAKLEQGDAEAVRLWKLFCSESLKSFQKLYARLGVEFDHYTGESFFNDKIPGTLERISGKGLSEKSEGALVVKLDEEKLPPCLLRKHDGSTLYATRDLSAAEYRWDAFHFAKCLYVVANQQELHFRQVASVLKRMGYDWWNKLVHVKFGMLSFGEGVFEEGKRVTGSTRRGKIVFLEDVLAKAVEKALQLLKENARGEEAGIDINALAEQIGVGAVIFNELGQRRMKDVVFTWEKALNLHGDSGPYLQYTHARLSSVMRKYGLELPAQVDFSPLKTGAEADVAKALARFPLAVKRAANEDEPAIVGEYLLDLASVFNRFFTDKANHRIISDDENLTVARVALVECVRRVMAAGLGLLGIAAPERM